MQESNLALATTGDSTGGEHLIPLLMAFLVPKFPLPLLLLYAFSRIRSSDAAAPDIDPMGAQTSWQSPRHEAEHKRQKAQQAHHEARAAAHKVVMNENAQASPQPWPQAVPKNLPPFPAGWEFAEPPSKAVQTRAWQLLEPLWAQGAGHTATELTEANWITYRAELVSNGKRGVVAYRVRAGARPAPISPAPAPAPLPPVARVPATPTMPARPVLRQGSGMGALVADAPWVVYLQKALAIEPADGKFGAHTADLVGAFQVRHGLTLDRVVGPLTWAAVDTAAPNIAHDHA